MVLYPYRPSASSRASRGKAELMAMMDSAALLNLTLSLQSCSPADERDGDWDHSRRQIRLLLYDPIEHSAQLRAEARVDDFRLRDDRLDDSHVDEVVRTYTTALSTSTGLGEEKMRDLLGGPGRA